MTWMFSISSELQELPKPQPPIIFRVPRASKALVPDTGLPISSVVMWILRIPMLLCRLIYCTRYGRLQVRFGGSLNSFEGQEAR